MFDKRLSPEGSSSSPQAKRRRAREGSSSTTVNWEIFVQRHLPSFYKRSPEKTNEDWKAIYQHYSQNMFKNITNLKTKNICSRVFSADGLLKIVSITELQKESFFQAIIGELDHLTSNLKDNARSLAILIHHRLPDDLANALYEKALSQKTTLSTLHWALICRRPLSEDMADDINQVSYTPAIHLAACFNKPSLITSLKDLGANLNLRNSSGANAFTFSIQFGFNGVAHQLISLGAEVGIGQNGNIWPSLFAAVVNGHNQGLELLLSSATSPKQDYLAILAFYRATCDRDVSKIRYMIQYDEIIRNLHSSVSIMPFIWAASQGFNELIGLFLEAKMVDVNGTTRGGNSALILAVQNGHLETAQFLLQSGAAVNQPTIRGVTALEIAVFAEKIMLIKLLMVYGATEGMKALHYAVIEGKSAIIDALFESGLYISPCDIPDWLQKELINRININSIIVPNSLQTVQSLPNFAVMPTGYSHRGEWLMKLMQTNEPRALLEFEAQDIKRPGALGIWFEGAVKDFSHFHLALNLTNSRLARKSSLAVRLSIKEELILYAGNIDALEAVYERYGFTSLMSWVSALAEAPEMLAWRHSCGRLSDMLMRTHLAEVEMLNESLGQQTHNFSFFEPAPPVAASSSCQSIGIESSHRN